jgi:hypothetical protein
MDEIKKMLNVLLRENKKWPQTAQT